LLSFTGQVIFSTSTFTALPPLPNHNGPEGWNGHQAQVDLHLLLPFSGQPTLGPLSSYRPCVHRHGRHRRPGVMDCRPSPATPMPLTGTAAPGAGPSIDPWVWSRGSRSRARRRTFFLMAGARRCPRTSVGRPPPPPGPAPAEALPDRRCPACHAAIAIALPYMDR